MDKILIVEDDKFLRDLLEAKLIKENFPISIAIDGEEGLRKARDEKPDLVLLDLILPGMNGFEILKNMKENPETVNIKVIILSNLGQEEEVEKAMALGATDYLIKAHFTLEEIVEKIKKVLK